MSGNLGCLVDFLNLILVCGFLGPESIVNSKHCCTRVYL